MHTAGWSKHWAVTWKPFVCVILVEALPICLEALKKVFHCRTTAEMCFGCVCEPSFRETKHRGRPFVNLPLEQIECRSLDTLGIPWINQGGGQQKKRKAGLPSLQVFQSMRISAILAPAAVAQLEVLAQDRLEGWHRLLSDWATRVKLVTRASLRTEQGRYE